MTDHFSQSEYARLLERIDHLTTIGASLCIGRDNMGLLEKVLKGAKALTNADGGTLYIKQGDELRFEVLINDSLGFYMGGTSGNPVTLPPISLHDDQGRPNESTVVTHCALHSEVVNIRDAYTEQGFDFSGTRRFDERTGYRSQSFLTLPLRNHESDVIGVLQLINRINEDTGDIEAFSEADCRFGEALAATAAVSLTGKALINDLQQLFEAFVEVIATAIDDKSPYTGGHCRRVPELTMMLAEATIATKEGPLRDFDMSQEEIYALKTAAWLHDCGKIVTPEHIMDKATKLETIHDRIETVDARFEILKRDQQISWLQQELAKARGCTVEEVAQQCLAARATQLDELEEQRRFLHRSNIGGEFMSKKDQQRVADIGAQTYDTCDGPQPLLSDDECENLQIPKGTLLPREREIINQHMDATIKMLDGLPFPRHLQQVPEFACGHHERMDGKGYPRGLTREQLSIPARMMAIADVFEALIACDRPYKKGKKLSECLRILGLMKLDHHIDPDLFDVFVREKVYLRYAQKFVNKDQIDEVDESAIPGYEG